MNRRSFLKFLSAIPIIRHIPLPRRLVYGSGNDGDIVLLPGNKWVSPYTAIKMMGGGGGAGGLIVVFPNDVARTITFPTNKDDKDIAIKPGVETADLKGWVESKLREPGA